MTTEAPTEKMTADARSRLLLSRRRVLQVSAAGTALTALPLPRWLEAAAEAATPLGPTEGVLVLVVLAGGNDGLNTVVPVGNSRYLTLRGTLAIPQASALPLAAGLGLNPNLSRLKARFDAGKVAVLQGVGRMDGDLSHFTSMATVESGTATSSRTTGWLGRWLDGLPDHATGLRGVAVGEAVPLTLTGHRAAVTALPTDGDLFGRSGVEAYDRAAYAPVQAFGASPTGRGRWADQLAATGRSAVSLADQLTPVLAGLPDDDEFVKRLVAAARLLNTDLGARVLVVTLDGFDTHDDQVSEHATLLSRLDVGIDTFFSTLSPALRNRVTLATFSEFGRRPERNDSGGTDHGGASCWFVVGELVRGGLYGDQPSLTALDERDNLVPTVDHRSVWASLVGPWLGGDADEILGGRFEDLQLFTATPGTGTPPPPPPPVVNSPTGPFPSREALVDQQYLDFLGRPADTAGRAYWAERLRLGQTPGALIASLVDSPEFGQVLAPVLRAYLACLGRDADREGLQYWASRRRSGARLEEIAASMADSPEFLSRFGALDDGGLVSQVYQAVLGRSPDADGTAYWLGRLRDGLGRGGLITAFSESPEHVVASRPRILTQLLYQGMLRRPPEPDGSAYWQGRLRAGESVAAIGTALFWSDEYRSRFPA